MHSISITISGVQADNLTFVLEDIYGQVIKYDNSLLIFIKETNISNNTNLTFQMIPRAQNAS